MPDTSSPDDIIGSFGDICVRRSDAELFAPGHWLNDTCISAYFEFLTTEKYEDSKLLLLPGSAAYFLLHGGDDDVAQQLSQMQAADRALIVLAVNDNPEVTEANGGSHWSLLALSTEDRIFRHFDSGSSGSNEAVARALAKKLETAFGQEHEFQEVSAPPQSNSFDCGMHVLVTAEVLCASELAGGVEIGEYFMRVLIKQFQPEVLAARRRLILAMFL